MFAGVDDAGFFTWLHLESFDLLFREFLDEYFSSEILS